MEKFDSASLFRMRTLLNNTADRLLLICISFWILYTLYIYLRTDALVPDEELFIRHSADISIFSSYTSPTKYGYGPLYWALMSVTGSWARYFAFALMLLTPLAILITIADRRRRVLVFLLWATCPIAFWGGKLVGPELWTLALSSGAVAAFHYKRPYLAGFACGLATGIKLVTLPIVVIVGLMILLRDFDKRSFIGFLALTCVGLLFAYPTILIYNPISSGALPITVSTFLNPFILYRWEWDAIFSGGILHFFMPLSTFLIVLVISIVLAPRVGIPIAVGAAFFAAMMIKGGSQYGWYGFSLIPPMIYAAGQSIPAPSLIGVVFLNGFLQLPLLSAMIHQKAEQHRVLNTPEARLCIQRYLDNTTISKIIDMSEFGLKLSWPSHIERVRYWGNPTAETAEAQGIIIMTRMLIADAGARQFITGYRISRNCPGSIVLEKN